MLCSLGENPFSFNAEREIALLPAPPWTVRGRQVPVCPGEGGACAMPSWPWPRPHRRKSRGGGGPAERPTWRSAADLMARYCAPPPHLNATRKFHAQRLSLLEPWFCARTPPPQSGQEPSDPAELRPWPGPGLFTPPSRKSPALCLQAALHSAPREPPRKLFTGTKVTTPIASLPTRTKDAQ